MLDESGSTTSSAARVAGPESTPTATVAVVVRTKNRPTLLPRALANIAEQTYQDYTVMVVNDGGDPEPVDTIVADLPDDVRARVHVRHHPTSIGLEGASNAAIRGSESTFVAIHDDDDTWAPEFLDRTVGHLDRTSHDAVATRTEVVHEELVDGQYMPQRRELLAPDKDTVDLGEILRHNYVPPISMLHRRRVHGIVGFYDDTLPVLGDWDFILRLLSHCPVDFIDGQPLAFWHHRTSTDPDLGNSVVAGASSHARYRRIIRDRYLRRHLTEGDSLGPLLYAASADAELNEHIDRAVAHLDRRIGEVEAAVKGQSREVVAQLEEMNRSLVSRNNRLVAQALQLHERLDALEQLVYSQTPRARLAAYVRIAKDRAQRLRSR